MGTLEVVMRKMKFSLRAKNIEITDPLRAYAEDKIGRLPRFLRNIEEAAVELVQEKDSIGATVSVTLYSRGTALLRADASATNMFSAIDLVSDKLERQIKRHKDKAYSSSANHRTPKGLPVAGPVSAEELGAIVETKQVDMKPMTPEEATMQMDMLGHDFFVFTNSDTERVNVVYRRRDNNYGLIEPS